MGEAHPWEQRGRKP
jgi:hypothetical protein